MEDKAPEKIREERLQDMAAKRGLRLSRCLSPGTHLTTECSYTLTDEHDSRPTAAPGMSLADVEIYLTTVGPAEVWDAAVSPTD